MIKSIYIAGTSMIVAFIIKENVLFWSKASKNKHAKFFPSKFMEHLSSSHRLLEEV